MLGRGTRRCDDINKSEFVIFDCFDGTLINDFRDASNFEIESPEKQSLSIPEIIENIWQNVDRAYHSKIFVKRLRRIEKDMSGDARSEFTKWIQDGDVGKFAAELLSALRDNFTETMKLLRNPKFQRLLLEYQRAKKSFWVTYEIRDQVSSRIQEQFGEHSTASDYLEAFSEFVRGHRDKIERPRDWRPEAFGFRFFFNPSIAPHLLRSGQTFRSWRA